MYIIQTNKWSEKQRRNVKVGSYKNCIKITILILQAILPLTLYILYTSIYFTRSRRFVYLSLSLSIWKLTSKTGTLAYNLYHVLTVVSSTARVHVLDDVISSVFKGYHSEVRPYCNDTYNNTVVVTIDIGVRQLVDLVIDINWK